MDLVNLFVSYGPWAWVVAGVVLLAFELVMPGGVLVWLGAAAIATGLLSLAVPSLTWPALLLVFGVLSIASIFVWLRYFKRPDKPTDKPFLNRRADRFLGRELVLREAISGGVGRVNIDDTVWRISGPDLAAGTRVKVVGSQGGLLQVEPVGA